MFSVIRYRTKGALGFCGLALWACNGIVGVKELHEGPDPSAGGAAGSGGTAGGNSAKGGSTAAGSGGKLASGGAGGGAVGSGGVTLGSGGSLGADGGSPSDGGAGAGGAEGGAGGDLGSGGKLTGTGGAATGHGGTATGNGGKASTGGTSSGGTNAGGASSGGSGGTSTVVSGTVIDLWGHPVPNVPVTIGEASTVTSATGTFSFLSVTAQYDVIISLHPEIGGGTGNYAWVYQGLTRRDPTLQVYRALPNQSASPTLKPTGASDTNTNAFAWGCPDGSNSLTFGASAAGTTPLDALPWFGPNQTAGAYHVLAFKQDTNGYPTEYSTYLTSALTVTADTPVTLPFTFTSTLQATGNVGGTVTSVTSSSRSNYLFARFKDNASIPIAAVTPSAAAFAFVAPQLTNTDITVAASEGSDSFYGPYSIAHKTVALGTTNAALSIPAPPSQIGPVNNAVSVNGNTLFSWASATDTVYVMHIESNPHYEGMYIVTAAKSTKLPDIGGGFYPNKNELHWWQVEVHGNFTTVDQAARPGGFIDTFARSRTEPDFYRAQDDGFASFSAATGFTTAP